MKANIIRGKHGKDPIMRLLMAVREPFSSWKMVPVCCNKQGRPCDAGGLRRHPKRGPIVYKFFFTCNINIKPKTLVFIMLKPKIILQQSIHKEGF